MLEAISTSKLNIILLAVEVIWVGLGIYVYLEYPEMMLRHFPFVFLINMLTVLPLIGVFRQLRKSTSKEDVITTVIESSATEETFVTDVWERVCIGFFIVTNLSLSLFISYLVFFR